MDDPEAVGRHDGEFVVREIDDPVGVSRQGARIARHEVLAVGHAHDQRAAEPGGDEQVGSVGEEHEQAVRAPQLWQGLANGGHPRRIGGVVDDPRARGDRPPEAAVDQVGDHLGIGLRAEDVALGLQHRLERPVVLDHPVVHDRHARLHRHAGVADAPQMRVRVGVGRRAVRRPAGVADADRRVGLRLPHERFQSVEPPRGLQHPDPAVLLERGDPGGVVSAVFEPTQPLHDQATRPSKTDIAHDATHGADSPRTG